MYCDGDRRLYRYFGFPAKAFPRVWNTQTLDYYVEQKLSGKQLPGKLDEHDDPNQMGGNVVIGRDGRVIWVYKMLLLVSALRYIAIMSNQQQQSSGSGAGRNSGNAPMNSAQLEDQRNQMQAEAYAKNDQRPVPEANQSVPRQEIHAMAAAQDRREQADNQKASQ